MVSCHSTILRHGSTKQAGNDKFLVERYKHDEVSDMSTIAKKQLEDYKALCFDRNHGLILTPDGLRFVCEACSYDAEAIGKHMLEVLTQIQAINCR